MRIAITAVLCVAICSLMTLLGFSDVNTESEHEDYTNNVYSLFQRLTIEIQKYADEKLAKDILDANQPDGTKLELAIEDVYTSYLERPSGYTIPKFWETGAEAVIKASFANDYTTNMSLPQLSWIDSAARTIVEQWLESKEAQVKIKFFSYTSYTSLVVMVLKAVVNEHRGVTKSRASSMWLNALRTELERQSDDDVRYIVTEPFMKKVIETIKLVEKTNQWPGERTQK